MSATQFCCQTERQIIRPNVILRTHLPLILCAIICRKCVQYKMLLNISNNCFKFWIILWTKKKIYTNQLKQLGKQFCHQNVYTCWFTRKHSLHIPVPFWNNGMNASITTTHDPSNKLHFDSAIKTALWDTEIPHDDSDKRLLCVFWGDVIFAAVLIYQQCYYVWALPT